MNEIEAKRIAAVVSIIRPEWREGHVMAALGDDRMRHRTYEDALVAVVACYTDMTTKKPGRIHESGRWWLTVTAQAPAPQIKAISDNDCAICFRPFELHSRLSATDAHDFEPQHARAKSWTPTPEQRSRLAKAATGAQLERTKAREEAETRPVRDPAEVIAAHTNPPQPAPSGAASESEVSA